MAIVLFFGKHRMMTNTETNTTLPPAGETGDAALG
jgi:hypothetical protein